MRRICSVCPLVLTLISCGEPAVLDVGDPESENLGQALSDYAAEWDGYAQAYTFPGDKTDRVRLTLDANGEGTIRLGEEELFPPATDPDAAHPPTHSAFDDLEPFTEPTNAFNVRSGFEYSISGANVASARLQFEFDTMEYMESWCALQANSPLPGWTCGSQGYSISFGDELACEYHDEDVNFYPVSCPRAVQCRVCICEDDVCGVGHENKVRFDAVITDDGQGLTGTLVLPSTGERVTIVLTKQPGSD